MKKILIANRGEIALRIIRTAQEMGKKTVAVYSEADRLAPHVRQADEAVLLGPAASNKSYLLMDKIIEAAKATKADAIHPGYGFLSENAAFATKVAEAGIIFIGPDAEAIRIMGNKLDAKSAVKSYNIPLLPGTEKAVTDVKAGEKVALEIGFPVLIKAAAGGGGKGMRIVNEQSEFASQMKRAISEAENAFGDGAVFIEKYITSPKHIEIQILADRHGNVIHLFERECSVQRRHQKVIEEAPSAVVTEPLRKEMGDCAIKVAKACNYVGAGTVEFLMDEQLNFYFLEMNTRLQVEHPVTEMITGTDLVREQIKIASGERLQLKQEELKINGHAIELRVYAEDPANDFLPDTGKISHYRPADGHGVRVDSGYEEGMEVAVHYDPLLAKMITHAHNREAAIEKMNRAINEFQIQGVANTLSFGRFVMNHPAFRDGSFDTHFVSNHFKAELLNPESADEIEVAALFTAWLREEAKISSRVSEESMSAGMSNWYRNRSVKR